MKLTVLGSGTLIPYPNRGNSGYYLEINNHKILIDGGAGSIRKAADFGLDYRQIDIITYTHLHPDHCYDLIPLMFGLKHDPLVSLPKTIRIIAPYGFRTYFNSLMKIYGDWVLSENIFFDIQEVYSDEFPVKDSFIFDALEIKFGRTQHLEHSVTYRYIEKEGKELIYSGDTDYCRDIIASAMNADILLLECSFPDNQKKTGHLTPSECGHIASESNVTKLVLTHFYPEILETDILKSVREKYDGEIVLAYDGLVIE